MKEHGSANIIKHILICYGSVLTMY